MNKKLLIGVVVVLVILGGYFVLKNSNSKLAMVDADSQTAQTYTSRSGYNGYSFTVLVDANGDCSVSITDSNGKVGTFYGKGYQKGGPSGYLADGCNLIGVGLFRGNTSNSDRTTLPITFSNPTDETNFLDWLAYKGYGCFKSIDEYRAYLKGIQNVGYTGYKYSVPGTGSGNEYAGTFLGDTKTNGYNGDLKLMTPMPWAGKSKGCVPKVKGGDQLDSSTGAGVSTTMGTPTQVDNTKTGKITRLQTLLKDSGFYTGKVTGVMDQATKSALVKFNASVGIQ